jgi:hypothetical protein
MSKLIKTYIFTLVTLFMLSSFSVQAGDANNGYNKQKVVYHVNNVHSATAAFRNIKNHLNAVGEENADIIVVTHSSGAFSLVEGAMGKKSKKTGKAYEFDGAIASLANRGVKFNICANTIRGKKIDKSKINLNATVVPSGVAEVAHLQQKGYLYVKP